MPKLSKKMLSSSGGTGATSAGKATPIGVTSPVMRNFSPLVASSSIPASKPKAGKRPNVHPVQRR